MPSTKSIRGSRMIGVRKTMRIFRMVNKRLQVPCSAKAIAAIPRVNLKVYPHGRHQHERLNSTSSALHLSTIKLEHEGTFKIDKIYQECFANTCTALARRSCFAKYKATVATLNQQVEIVG